MKMNTKLFGVLLIAFVVAAFAAPFALATSDLQVDYIKIDGEELDDFTSGTTLEVERGEALDIRVRVTAINNDVEDVQVSAGLYGYDYSQYESSKIYDVSSTFDLDLGNTRNVDLDLEIPLKMDAEDMTLRILVADRNSKSAQVFEYQLDVEGTSRDNAVIIKEAYLSPSETVMAGRAVSALVKIENIGQRVLDDITLIVSVPELGIRDTETLDELKDDEVETFEKIILRFPSDTKPGNYIVEYTVKYDEYESTKVTDIVTVTPCQNTVCAASSANTDNDKKQDDGRTVVQVPGAQLLYQGASEAIYPVTLSNLATSAKAYTIQVSGVSAWGTARVEPGASVVIPAQSTATVFIYVGANEDAQVGEKYFKVTVGTPDGEMKEIPLSAQVAPSQEGNDTAGLQRTLEIALIILIILLILIGLIVGFNKLRGKDNDDDTKTYY